MAHPVRPSWVEIDLAAIVHNAKLTRELVGPDVQIFGVCKADAMGCGLIPVARTFADAGIDALAVSDPDEAAAIKEAGISIPVFLFASTIPEQAAEIAALGAIVAIHDFPSLEAFAGLGRPVEAIIKIDCGMGRLGFTEKQWRQAFQIARKASALRIRGLYTHMSKPEDRDTTRNQAATFERAYDDALQAGLTDLIKMAASSRVVLGYPEYRYSAVDPGRLLMGMLAPPWTEILPLRPVVRALKSRIMQVQNHPAGTMLGIGYEQAIAITKPMTTAVIPIGFRDGLNHAPPLGTVLVCGRRVPALGRRSIEHTLLDVTDVPDARVGSEVVLLGRQGDQEITGADLAASLNMPMLELLPRIASSAHRVYI